MSKLLKTAQFVILMGPMWRLNAAVTVSVVSSRNMVSSGFALLANGFVKVAMRKINYLSTCSSC